MKKLLIFPVIFLIIAGCSKTKKEPEIYFTHEKALSYFRSVDSICAADNGKLWGVSLAGPVMFVDRPTRRVFANKPDSEGLLKLRDDVYQGIFPHERLIENSAVEFGGTVYAMTPLPSRDDAYRIKTAAINSLFHCYQKAINMEPQRNAVRYLDDRFARIWLKLEYRALRKAVESDSLQALQHLRDAVIFRGARREQFQSQVTDENRSEVYEGLAMLTSILLCNKTEEEAVEKLLGSIDFFYRFQSFSRSYSPILGCAYSYLLYRHGFDLRPVVKCDTADLGNLAANIYKLQLPEIFRDVAGSLALIYDVDSIYKEEEKRMNDIRERIRRQLSKFTDKPVLLLELESPYFDFEPEDIRSLDTLGTIYNTIRVSDNWGKLTVEKGGCLVSYNLKQIRLGARNLKESKNHYYGDGWHLILNGNLKVEKTEDNYILKKSL